MQAARAMVTSSPGHGAAPSPPMAGWFPIAISRVDPGLPVTDHFIGSPGTESHTARISPTALAGSARHWSARSRQSGFRIEVTRCPLRAHTLRSRHRLAHRYERRFPTPAYTSTVRRARPPRPNAEGSGPPSFGTAPSSLTARPGPPIGCALAAGPWRPRSGRRSGAATGCREPAGQMISLVCKTGVIVV